MTTPSLDLRLRQIRLEAEGICSFEFFAAAPGQTLPSFQAGSHIDLQLPGNQIRSYSLANPPQEADRYLLAVQREGDGRGGSVWMHDSLRVGQVLRASTPVQDFPLEESADHSVLIAGGIGITPLLSMVARLDALGRSWRLHYAGRTRACTAFVDRLTSLDRGRGWVTFCLGDERARRLDIPAIVAAAGPTTHLYCCGPTRMIDSFIEASSGRPSATVHYERFAAAEEAATEGGYAVYLARSGRRLPVPPGKTLLDTLLDANVDVPYACSNGICGTCLTRVISGVPDHRDEFLSTQEKATGRSILVCCSGSRSATLELDL